MQAILTTLKRLTNLSRHLRPTRRPATPSTCLGLDALEDRLVPSTTPAALLTPSAGISQAIALYRGPAAPSGFSVQEVSNSSVRLSWNIVYRSNGYLVEEAVGSSWVQIAKLSWITTSFSVSGLAANNDYSFRVGVYNSLGTGWTSSQSVVTVDHPNANGETYSAATGSLFDTNGPSYRDVQQGFNDDCWLLATLAEVAAREPQAIRAMFTYVGTNNYQGTTVGVYTVRLYDNSGTPHYMTVDTELPTGTFTDKPANGTYWAALVEKAYVEANVAGIVTTNDVGSDSYSALGANNGGLVNWALQAILGHTDSNDDATTNPSAAAAAMNAGKLVLLCTTTPADSYDIVSDHVYALVAYWGGSQGFEVYNPWGVNAGGSYTPRPYNGHLIPGDFYCSATYLTQNFHDQVVSGGAGGDQGHPAAGFVTELPVSLNRAAFAGIGFTQTDTTNTSNSAATVPVTKPVEATAQPAVLTPASIAPARELFWAQADKLDLRPDLLGQSRLPF